jgi:hypothetical protein
VVSIRFRLNKKPLLKMVGYRFYRQSYKLSSPSNPLRLKKQCSGIEMSPRSRRSWAVRVEQYPPLGQS